jgi:hypothetical protein
VRHRHGITEAKEEWKFGGGGIRTLRPQTEEINNKICNKFKVNTVGAIATHRKKQKDYVHR